ncbi:hypothetical protein Droror1_Dr00027086 [Drosera rotundifolia]
MPRNSWVGLRVHFFSKPGIKQFSRLGRAADHFAGQRIEPGNCYAGEKLNGLILGLLAAGLAVDSRPFTCLTCGEKGHKSYQCPTGRDEGARSCQASQGISNAPTPSQGRARPEAFAQRLIASAATVQRPTDVQRFGSQAKGKGVATSSAAQRHPGRVYAMTKEQADIAPDVPAHPKSYSPKTLRLPAAQRNPPPLSLPQEKPSFFTSPCAPPSPCFPYSLPSPSLNLFALCITESFKGKCLHDFLISLKFLRHFKS